MSNNNTSTKTPPISKTPTSNNNNYKSNFGKHDKSQTLKSIIRQEKSTTVAKKSSVIKKKRIVLFKDTVSSPYLTKNLSVISNEYSDKLISLLNNLLKHDREIIQQHHINKENSYESIKKQSSIFRKTSKKLKSNQRKITHIENDKTLSPQDKEKELKKIQDTDKTLSKEINQLQETIKKLKEIYQKKKKEQRQEEYKDKNCKLDQFWIGVNKITREMEKVPIDSIPSIKFILVCPNPEMALLTNHLTIMAYLRRIPICLLGKNYCNLFSECTGMPNSVLAIAVRSNNNDKMDIDDEIQEFVKLGCEASKSVPSIDYPWLPEKLSGSNLTEPLQVNYSPVNVVRENNKRFKMTY